MIKSSVVIALFILILLTWTTLNVCNFNESLIKKNNNIYSLKVEDNIDLGKS
mgnify:CR=1 FL=1